MKILQKVCLVLLMGTFSSVYGGGCGDGDVKELINWTKRDVYQCKYNAKKGNVSAQNNLGDMYKKVKVFLRIIKKQSSGLSWQQKKEMFQHKTI